MALEAEVVYEYACYNLNNDEYELAKGSNSRLKSKSHMFPVPVRQD